MWRRHVLWRLSVSAAVNSRRVTCLAIVGGLALTGWGLQDVESSLWAETRAGRPALRLDSRFMAAGQGVLLGVAGGFRPAVADLLWLRMSGAWEERNLPATESTLQLVAVIDPEPLYFWLNGARIVAYDLAAWRCADVGGHGAGPAGTRQRIIREQARRALALLDEAMKFHPASAALWVERANIELNQLRDLRAAAESYRRAWEQPQAPFFAARLHAELLRRMGAKDAALAWLVNLHPRLPAGDEAAGAELVLARIRALELELGIPAERAYRVTEDRTGQKPGLPLISPRNGRSL